MKGMRKLSAILLAVMLCVGIMNIPVFAATTSQNGLEVTLTTDKDEYSQGEEITATLTVKNTNDFAVNNIKMEQLVPEGYDRSEDSKTSKQIDVLKAGETVTLSVVYESETLTIGGDSSNDTDDESTNAETDNSSPNKTDVETGDNNNMIFYFGILIVSAMVISVILFARVKGGKRFLSLFLSVVMLGSAVLGYATPVEAKTLDSKVDLEHMIKVDGSSISIAGIVNYQITIDDVNSTCVVSFEANAEDVQDMPENQTIKCGENVKYPNMPTKEGYSFAGWYLNPNETDLKNQYDFSAPVTSDVTLYAKWIDIDQDVDKDEIPDEIEIYFGSDPEKTDTDSDGLSDYEESIVLGTDSTLMDSDNNGISDYDEDADGDGLTNGFELSIGCNPIAPDTDYDGLSDSEEINGSKYKTDPLLEDTDNDGANDTWEIEHGFDPTVSNEKFDTVTEAESPEVTAKVTTNLSGEKAESLTVEPLVNHPVLTSSIPGYIGVPFEFTVDNNLENTTATISFTFDSEASSADDFKPTIYYWNEETQLLEELPTKVEGNTASTEVTHFSTYILLNKTEFDTVWENEIKPPLSGGEGNEDVILDIMFVIDYSSSMYDNDGNQLFKILSKNFVEKLRDEKDKAGAVKFIRKATLVSDLTTDKEAVVNAINGIRYDDGYGSYSGTDGSAGIKLALDKLNESKSKYQYIVFITDGEDNGFSYSYDELVNQANQSEVVIYAIGMGSASEETLKEISSATGGKYYHATTDTTVDDLINLDEVFKDIESETIDLTTDTDNDLLPDYYEQRLATGGGEFLNLDINNPDCDGDGLLDGEEFVIETSSDGRVYGKLKSHPLKYFSDSDSYNDYDEVKTYYSNPLVNNVAFSETDTTFLINDENYVSDKYLDFYENKWYGWLERASLWIGNNVFSSNDDVTYLYKTILMEYLEQMVEENEGANEIREIVGFTHKVMSQMNNGVDKALEVATADQKDLLINLKQQMTTYSKNLDDIANGDLINAGYTKDEVYKLWDDMFAEYKNVSNKVPELETKIEFNTKVGKVSKGIGIALDVADVVLEGYDVYKEYNTFANKIAGMENCLITLETIQNDSSLPSELKTAANELYKTIEEQKVTNLDTFFDALSQVGGKIANIGATAGLVKIPVVGKYIAAAKLALGVADFVFNVSDVSEACTCLYAISKASTIAAKDFSKSISKSENHSKWKNVYNGYVLSTDKYFALSIMRKTSERQMKNADEANSFFLEWIFTEIMYKTELIDKNIKKIDDIKYNYVVAGAN